MSSRKRQEAATGQGFGLGKKIERKTSLPSCFGKVDGEELEGTQVVAAWDEMFVKQNTII